ncbi:MAG: V-type ATP synthase subunit E family protein [Thiobacillaceae bacterium]|jgi:V/A-type H+-transporting ATPase subunit E
MESETQVSQLETALLNQAQTLAREEMRNAEVVCNRIRSEASARLNLLEEREILSAKADAERLFRRRVQAEETHLSGDLDRLRWTLSEAVLSKVREGLISLTQDQTRYFEVLSAFLAEGVHTLPAGRLVAEVNATDLSRLHPVWADFTRISVPDCDIELAGHNLPSIGGMRLRTEDNRVRLDQTFESRMARLEQDLARVAMEQLFSGRPNLDQLIQL